VNYGPYIDAAINRALLSNAEIAARVGVTDDAVRKWRRGEGVKLSNLERLADALGVLVGDLLPNSGGGAVSEVFEPLAAALMGLDRDEIRDQVLLLSSQTTLMRNAILQRVGKPGINEERSNVSRTQHQIEDDAPPIHGLELGEDDESPSRNGEHRAQRNRPSPRGKGNPTP
jgi:transcriptional regulator with XRE-family HTH domain